MEHQLTNFYKLQISYDLIMFLINVQTHGLPLKEKAEKTNMILDAWEKNYNINLQKLTDTTIKNVAKSEGMELDVAKIVTNIHQIEPGIIRKEFKVEVRHSAFRSFDKQT